MPQELNWGFPVALDLFLAGMAAGALMVAVVAQMAGDRRYRAVSLTGALIAPWPAILGVLLLVVDLGVPWRFWELLLRRGEGFLMFNPTSTMSIGTWLMTLFIFGSLAYLAVSLLTIPFRWGAKVRTVAGLCTLPLALLVTIYTGVLLSATPRVPWSTPLLPTLFVTSAIATGIASVVFVLAVFQTVKASARVGSPVPRLERLISMVLCLQLLVTVAFVLLQITSTQMKFIIGPGLGLLWWIGIIGLGLILPLVAGFKPGVKKLRTSIVVSALVLLGGLLLRYVILVAGQTA